MRLPWEFRVNMNTQLAFGRSEYGDFLQNQLPKTILFFGGQMAIIVQNMLRCRDDLDRCLIGLCAGFLFSHQVSLSRLQAYDFFGKGSVSLCEHIDGVNALFQILADCILLLLKCCKLRSDCIKCLYDWVDRRLLPGIKLDNVFIQPVIHSLRNGILHSMAFYAAAVAMPAGASIPRGGALCFSGHIAF